MSTIVSSTARPRFQHDTFTPEQIEQFAERLPAAYLQVLRLASMDNSYSQIAGELGVQPGTIKSRLNRARHALLLEVEKAKAAFHD